MLKLKSIESMMPSNHLILCPPSHYLFSSSWDQFEDEDEHDEDDMNHTILSWY